MIADLKALPFLPPNSRLKTLTAIHCGLEKIHPSLIQSGIELDLRYNNIKELPEDVMKAFVSPEKTTIPKLAVNGLSLNLSYNLIEKMSRDAMIQYLKANGNLGKIHEGQDEIQAIVSLDFNPLIYVPYTVYLQGEGETEKYLENFSPSEMQIPKQISVMLVGDSTEGKSALGRTLERGEPQAADDDTGSAGKDRMIGKDDRSEAFDVYRWEYQNYTLIVIDMDGQHDHHLMLPLLCRDHGLFVQIISYPSLQSDEKLALERLGEWVRKICEVAVGPQFVVALTKTDEIKGSCQARKEEVERCLQKLRHF